jgi:prepilin-type N-terminal cleavage/methylation domain-containing protein
LREEGYLLAEKKKNNLGYSLIELVVVIAIIAVLTVALGFQYVGWRAKYKVESQVKEVYSDLMTARMKAMQTNRTYHVFIAGNTYRIEQSTDDAETSFEPAPGWTPIKRLDYPISWTGTIVMNNRGLIKEPASVWDTSGFSFWFRSEGVDADYDCIFLRPTSINLGKWEPEVSSCNVK